MGRSADGSVAKRHRQSEPCRRSGDWDADGGGAGDSDRCRFRQRSRRCCNWRRRRSSWGHRCGNRPCLRFRLGSPETIRHSLSAMHVREGKPHTGYCAHFETNCTAAATTELPFETARVTAAVRHLSPAAALIAGSEVLKPVRVQFELLFPFFLNHCCEL
jgi:hypothetical protein